MPPPACRPPRRSPPRLASLAAVLVVLATAGLVAARGEAAGPPLLPRPPSPVVLVHGLCGGIWTWSDFSARVAGLGWRSGGHVGASGDDLALTAFLSGTADADYYAVQFADPAIRGGLGEWALELRAALRRIGDFRVSRGLPAPRFVVVAHSAGGLAARAYLQTPGLEDGHIAHLITYGTPHRGVELAPVADALAPFVPGCAFGGGQGLQEMRPSSSFLADLNSRTLPGGIRYSSLVGQAAECWVPAVGAPALGDCLVSAESQHLPPAVLPSTAASPAPVWRTGRCHTAGLCPQGGQPADTGNIVWAIEQGTGAHPAFRVEARSPVDLRVTDGFGRSVGLGGGSTPLAAYDAIREGDERVIASLRIPAAAEGPYAIEVIPRPDARPDDAFTLTAGINGTTVTLAQAARVQDIDGAPYRITLPPAWPPALVAAVLPAGRSVAVGAPATAFVTVANVRDIAVSAVGIFPVTRVPAAFTYQTTDPATNAVTGLPDVPAAIPPRGSQTFVIAVTPTAPFLPNDIAFEFRGGDTPPAPIRSGVNTLLLSASSAPVPDIVALAATLESNGIVDIPGSGATGVFSVAAMNLGAPGRITVTGDTGSLALPVGVALCRTHPITGHCASGLGPSVTGELGTGETPTYGVFVTASEVVPFEPGAHRVFVRFADDAGIVRGATSVAIRTR